MTPELEQKIRKRIEWQTQRLAEIKVDSERGPIAYQRTEAYIAALKWVLEIANV